MCPGSSPCDDYIATGECRSVGSLVFFCGVGLKPRGREVCVCVCESGKGGGDVSLIPTVDRRSSLGGTGLPKS